MRDISLLDDFLFKIVFGNQKYSAALVALLNAILKRQADQRIESLEIQNPTRSKDRPHEKDSILDVKAKACSGEFFNIEVQLSKQSYHQERTVYYGTGMLTQQPILGKDYS